MSSLRSLPPLGGHNFVQNTRAIIYNDSAQLRTRMRIFIVVLKPHPQSILRGMVCGTNVHCCNVHPASFNQLANETRYSRGSFARNSSRQNTPTTESPPSVKQSWTTSNPERCSFIAFEPPKVRPTCRSPFSSARF